MVVPYPQGIEVVVGNAEGFIGTKEFFVFGSIERMISKALSWTQPKK